MLSSLKDRGNEQALYCNISLPCRDRVVAELERESEFKDKARTSGMIRPFLLLVAMPPFLRCQVCNALGLPLFNQDFFGDPHREAWYAINANAYGIQARANRAYEKINPFADNCSWWYVLTRTMATTLRKHVANPDLNNEECSDSTNPSLAELEEIFLEEVISQIIQQNFTVAQREEWDAQIAEETTTKAYRKLAEAGRITKIQVLIYATNIVRTATGIGKLSLSILALQAAQSLIPAATSVLAPAVLGLSTIAMPVMILGVFGLAMEGIQSTIGSSEQALLPPLTVILNQRLLLAAEGLTIEDYY
eukprot:TRINITY_DN6903_c0_g1_i4.p1 TRINITY_DN6903_c0_g1~~TRINITY_DN6903_c0_g1_i4.p1  ORF type:complete len:306 (+),score=60.61 TRINITY_DN6903_c0_g1_i4:1191-2108(+)